MRIGVYVVVSILLFYGCSDFLKESSQDEIRPSTVSDMEQMLLGDGYIGKEYNFYDVTETFTDNMQSFGVAVNALQGEHNQFKWSYIWDKDMFTESGNGHNKNVWQAPYEGILGCNLILDYVDDMYGDHRLRESIKGEALVLRSWYYLHLVNFFGIAYNQGDPSKNLGVPLKLETAVTGEFFARNTVKEVYNQIEKDLLEGNRLLKEYDFKRNFYRVGHLAAKAMLSRVYLYMEDWDKALAYADSVLQQQPALLNQSSLSWQVNSVFGRAGVYDPTTPDEIIWSRETAPPSFMLNTMAMPPFSISDDLSSSYENGTQAQWLNREIRDLRAWTYFFWQNFYFSAVPRSSTWYQMHPLKNSNNRVAYQGIRTAEMYLNRAEAYIQKYISEGNEAHRIAALNDINTLRKNRYNDMYEYTEVNITNGQELLEFCIAERRRELVGETNHRWCDLRRYGMTISHTLVEDGSTVYSQDMSQYAMPIPEEIIRLNPYLVQNR